MTPFFVNRKINNWSRMGRTRNETNIKSGNRINKNISNEKKMNNRNGKKL